MNAPLVHSFRPPLRRRASPLRRRALGAAGILFSAVWLVAIVAWGFVIIFAQRSLTVESGNFPADGMVVLGGRYPFRAERAAELYKQGAAPTVLLSGRDDANPSAQRMNERGVPLSAMIFETKSSSTLQNAEY